MTLSGGATAKPTFTAPATGATLVFSLVVGDGTTSSTDTVAISVTSSAALGYRSTVLGDGPLAFWRLGESSGVVAADATQHGFSGIYVASPVLGQTGAISGDGDTAVSLNGLNQYVQVPFSSALNPTVFSVEAWAYATGGAGTFRSVVTSRDTPTQGYSIYASDTNTWQGWLGTGSSSVTLTGPAVAPNTWTHLLLTSDGTAATLYVNGVPAASTALSYVANGARVLRIGEGKTEAAPGYPFPGKIDDVAVYGSALSAGSASAHYQAGQTPPTTPTVAGLAPSSGAVGSTVTVTGTNLAGAAAVRFNGVLAPFTVVSATSITATVPVGATSGLVSVTTPGGTASSPSAFTVTTPPPPAPVVSGVSPASGVVGSSVTVSGSNLAGASAVKFNGVSASFTVVSTTSITATVPTGATSGPVSVTTPGGTASSSTSFTVTTAGGGDGGGGGGGGGGGAPADLALTMSASATSVAVGDTLVYRIAVQVANPTATSGVTHAIVTDTLPAGVQLVSAQANRGPGCSGTSSVRCDLDFLSGTLVGEIVLTVRVTAPGSQLNTASVTAPEPDPNPSNNAASVTVNASSPTTPSPGTPAPKLKQQPVPGTLLHAVRTPTLATVTSTVAIDKPATVTMSVRDARTGKALSLLRGSKLATTTLTKPALQARARIAAARSFRIAAVLSSQRMNKHRRYVVVVKATGANGKSSELLIRCAGS